MNNNDIYSVFTLVSGSATFFSLSSQECICCNRTDTLLFQSISGSFDLCCTPASATRCVQSICSVLEQHSCWALLLCCSCYTLCIDSFMGLNMLLHNQIIDRVYWLLCLLAYRASFVLLNLIFMGCSSDSHWTQDLAQVLFQYCTLRKQDRRAGSDADRDRPDWPINLSDTSWFCLFW